jgi:hypothetical protein
MLPVIRTAIPKRRYRVGDQSVTVLGEIESGDGLSYRWIMAFVQDGQTRPGLYLCAEKPGPGPRLRLRVVNGAMSEVIEEDARWRDLDTFADEALRIGASALGLGAETPARLL